MTINERFSMVRKDAGLSMEKFGARIMVSRNSISLIESGANNPSKQTIELVSREFNVRREWLETGEGEMYDLPLDEEAAMFARLAKKTSASAEALKLVIRCYLSLGDDGIAVLDQLIDQAIKDGHTKKDPEV